MAFFFILWKLANWGTEYRIKQLCQCLNLLGIRAYVSMLTDLNYIYILKHELIQNESIVATITLEGSDIDSINVIREWGYFGHYHLDFLVRTPGKISGGVKRKTEIKMKRGSLFENKVTEVEWKGDINLAMKLNSDSILKHKLLNAQPKYIRNDLEILPEIQNGYTRLETLYFLPTAEQFDVLETIARNIKS